MAGSRELAGAGARNGWRIARWSAAVALLLTPLAMMQVSDEWHWEAGSFVFAGIMIGGVGLLYELAERISASRAYRAGAAVALTASFLSIWAVFVRDDGTGIGYFLVVLAAGVGGFAAAFRAAGMARAMLGVAAMQALLGLAIATAPMTANEADGPFKAMVFGGVFAALWLASALFFHAAAKGEGVTGGMIRARRSA